MSETAQIRPVAVASEKDAPVIEAIAQRITQARKALGVKLAERDKAHMQIKVWIEQADKAGESIVMLEARIASLNKQMLAEVGQ